MRSKNDKLEAALFTAQGKVGPLYRTLPAHSPKGEIWHYVPFDEVQPIATKALRDEGLVLNLVSSRVTEETQEMVFRVLHVESGQYRLITLHWLRHISQNFNEPPLACKATTSYGWAAVALDLLQIQVLPKSAKRDADRSADRAESEPSSPSDVDLQMTPSRARDVLPSLIQRYGDRRGTVLRTLEIWNREFPTEATDRQLNDEQLCRLASKLHVSLANFSTSKPVEGTPCH